MHDRRDGVEEGELGFAGERLRRRAASDGEVRGPVATMTLSQSAGGRPSISSRTMVISGVASRRCVTSVAKPVAIDGERAAGGKLVAVGRARE